MLGKSQPTCVWAGTSWTRRTPGFPNWTATNRLVVNSNQLNTTLAVSVFEVAAGFTVIWIRLIKIIICIRLIEITMCIILINNDQGNQEIILFTGVWGRVMKWINRRHPYRHNDVQRDQRTVLRDSCTCKNHLCWYSSRLGRFRVEHHIH